MGGHAGGQRQKGAGFHGSGSGSIGRGNEGGNQGKCEIMVVGGNAEVETVGVEDSPGSGGGLQGDVAAGGVPAISDDQAIAMTDGGKPGQPVKAGGQRGDRGGRAFHVPCLARTVPSGRYGGTPRAITGEGQGTSIS